MRLGDWRETAPSENVLDDRVLNVLVPVLEDLGAESDPECWIVWGEDPDMRYTVLAPTLAGLISAGVRFNNAEEGPRVVAKLIRWSKLTISELGLESSGGHRVVAVQIESTVIKGTDEEADRICEFVRGLIAGVEDRLQGPMPIVVGGVDPSMFVAPAAAGKSQAARGAPRPAAPVKPSKPARPEPVKVVAAIAPPHVPAPAEPAAAAPALPKVVPVKPGSLPVPPAADAPPAQPVAPAAAASSPAAAAVAVPAPSLPPTPIASRAAARQNPPAAAADATPAPGSAATPETQTDRATWVGPHPIEEVAPPAPQQKKPRPWMP